MGFVTPVGSLPRHASSTSFSGSTMTRSLLLLELILATSVVSAADWPQWMGENRDDVWSEKGILEEFPENGLTFLWRTPVSGGFSGPAVANGKVYVTDYVKSS